MDEYIEEMKEMAQFQMQARIWQNAYIAVLNKSLNEEQTAIRIADQALENYKEHCEKYIY